MSEMNKQDNNFVGYEYKNMTVKRSMESVYADGYKNFGWVLENTTASGTNMDTVSMKFKRDRKICNKAELTRLQRQFEACVNEIETMERSKTSGASIAAFTVGIVGTAFMALSTFSYLNGMVPLMIILAIPGFLGWIIPYFCFNSMKRSKTAKVAPLIDKKYDEIYEVCEKGNGLFVG